MNSTALSAALGVLLVLASAAFFFFGRRAGRSAERETQLLAKATAEQTSQRIVGEAEREAESLRKSALISGKEELIKLRENWEVEARRRREEVEREEKRVQDRETMLDRKFDVLEQREKDVGRRASELGRKEKTIAEREQELDRLVGEEKRRLETLAGISAEQTAEIAVSAVSLPNDEMKGRIIGREGRNIRAFELATGVDVIIDDTPDTVVVSCFDPVRRETARLALEKLVSDGRIHPGRIEEVVNKSRKEIETQIVETGEQAAYDAGVHGLHPELVKLVGRMRWRTSYGQNILN